MSAHGPHDWVDDDDGYGCAVCGGRYHCAQCSDSSSMMGHYVSDGDGHFFHCQDPERWQRHLRSKGGVS